MSRTAPQCDSKADPPRGRANSQWIHSSGVGNPREINRLLRRVAGSIPAAASAPHEINPLQGRLFAGAKRVEGIAATKLGVETRIEPDGSVYPCNRFTDEPASLGNVNEQPFLEIWFDEKCEVSREMLAEQGGRLPIC